MTPKKAYEEALQVGTTPELEAIIATSAYYSYSYALCVLDGRFELGEAGIATSAECSYKYARYVLCGRFELGEAAIATHAGYSYMYAKDVLGGSFELGEAAIATDARWSREYRRLKAAWDYPTNHLLEEFLGRGELV